VRILAQVSPSPGVTSQIPLKAGLAKQHFFSSLFVSADRVPNTTKATARPIPTNAAVRKKPVMRYLPFFFLLSPPVGGSGKRRLNAIY
jgi:hypothetical protein